ncbi:uncharacterized protein PV09_05051 [Verruconis gallopava]|uniref:magnesium chelatase n=1 Tax=Verruconis gallopava TaxID=253628 RepID=A0A0D2AX31_9PEZI|nr:uncharacterized protein PV09_05051 [Verruconis gallopava]KIW03744.1 hypothetical protein PV09_05051 [Verruconis gallopava]
MEYEKIRLAEKAQELGDIELAVLLCLVAEAHCIIEADVEDIEQAEKEIQSICHKTFGLTTATLNCTADMSLDDFDAHILVYDAAEVVTPTANQHIQEDYFSSSDAISKRTKMLGFEDDGKIADVIVARDLHLAPVEVQVQALELMRGKRVFTRRALYTAPKRFVLVALNTADKGPKMMLHLNNHFSISHFYQHPDSSAASDIFDHENTSTRSNVRSRPSIPAFPRQSSGINPFLPFFQKYEIDEIAKLSSRVKLHPDVRAYMHNIVVFMRMHRAVASGVTPHATRSLYSLTSALASLHGLDFITPSLVALAVRKIYPHRLVIVKPEDEMSLQWGSELDAVREYLDGITAEDVIDDVLGMVETPL